MNILHYITTPSGVTKIWFAHEGHARYVQVREDKDHPDVRFFHCPARHLTWEEGIVPASVLAGTPEQMLAALFGTAGPVLDDGPILGSMYLEREFWEDINIPPVPVH